MSPSTPHDHFLGLWRRALQLSTLSQLDASVVADWARQRGLAVHEVAEQEVGCFQRTPAIVLTVDGGIACFPVVSPTEGVQWQNNRRHADRDAQLWEKMEWFSPLWVSWGKLDELLSQVATRSRADAIQLFDYHLSTEYTLAFQAMCIAQLLPGARSISEFVPLVREAYLAFYSGHRASSIAALIPAVEGALRKIAAHPPDLTVTDQVDRAIDRAVAWAARLHFNEMWVPHEYLSVDYLFGQDERVFTFETFRRWLKCAFFRRTGEYDGTTWLNRHVFAHGMSADWQQSANFSRLIVALATLGVIDSWNDPTSHVPLLTPEMNQDSTFLWQQALLRAQLQMALNIEEEALFLAEGRLVPPLPIDDGVTLRQVILSEDCIRDLVRPLREAGWSVEVGEPDERALHIIVVARCDAQWLTVALLYSCATSNEIYRELANKSDVILYRGAPYHQTQFASGIDVHVGPVTGWQPPRPCTR